MKLILVICFGLATAYGFAQAGSLPITLSLPMDADTVAETTPTFIWQANLSTIQNDPRFTMNLTIVKLNPNQTASEGIIENTPVQIYANLLSNSIQYSSTAPALEENVWYAWQIILYYNGLQVQQSEVWKFILAEEQPEEPTYYRLRTQVDNSFIELDGKIVYVTTNEPGTFQLTGVISGKGITTQDISFQEIVNNELVEEESSVATIESRFFQCDLTDLNLKKGSYRIQWDANSSKHFVFFIKKI